MYHYAFLRNGMLIPCFKVTDDFIHYAECTTFVSAAAARSARTDRWIAARRF